MSGATGRGVTAAPSQAPLAKLGAPLAIAVCCGRLACGKMRRVTLWLTLLIVWDGGFVVVVGGGGVVVIAVVASFDWSLSVFFVGEAIDANAMGFVDTLLQSPHKHSPNYPVRLPFNDGNTTDIYSEKNLSPLSSGRISACGKGRQQPTSVAMLFTHHSSE